MTEADKLLVLIASAVLAALFVHRYADLSQVAIPTITMIKAEGSGIQTD